VINDSIKICELENINRLISYVDVNKPTSDDNHNKANVINKKYIITCFDILQDKLMIVGCKDGSILI